MTAPPQLPVLLSYGMGVDSTAILLRWLFEPRSRSFPLSQLTVLTAQVGDEHSSSYELVAAHILPLLRSHGVRFVQVARGGPSRHDGVLVLDDSRAPERVHRAGPYSLSDEGFMNGVVPQLGGIRKCSLKHKGFPLDRWIDGEFGEERHRHAVGFCLGEERRATRDTEATLDRPWRQPYYPLLEWGWDREACLDYIEAKLGVRWLKSCCVFCPFTQGTSDAVSRLVERPAEAAKAVLLETLAVAFNPRSGLYGRKGTLQERLMLTPAWAACRSLLEETPWRVYEVSRVWPERGNPSRSVRHVSGATSRSTALTELSELAETRGLPVGLDHRAIIQERDPQKRPTREHWLVAAPALAAEKQGPGFKRRWESVNQLSLLGQWT